MKILIYTIMAFFYFHPLSAQRTAGIKNKPPIDTADLLIWPRIPDGPHVIISNNGEYLLYRVWHIPPESISVMIKSVKKDWEITLSEAKQAMFTDDSRRLVFITPHDSICIMTLPDMQRDYVDNVSSFKLFMHEKDEMLIYQRVNPKKELVLHQLTRGTKHVFENIDNYLISKDGRTMLLQKSSDTAGYATLLWMDIKSTAQKIIWKGRNANNLCFDESGEQLAFLVHDSTANHNALWLYKSDRENAKEVLKTVPIELTGNMKIVAINRFNKDGKRLFFQISEQSPKSYKYNQSPVTTWGYSDPKLQTLQAFEKPGDTESYLAILDIQSPLHIWQVQQQDEGISANNYNDLVVLTLREGSASERHWNKAASCSTFLVMVNDKKKIPIALANTSFSPDHKYLLGNQMEETWGSDLYVYEIATKAVRNITNSIPKVALKKENDMLETNSGKGLVFAGWLSGGAGLLVYDDYDIWHIDPTGKRNATKLTSGREKKIQFRLAEDGSNFSKKVIQPGQPILLTAFNTKTKQNGFYRLKWATEQTPELLFMGDYFFSKVGGNSYFLKARDCNMYLVRQEQTDRSPNIFYTEGFRSFSPVTHLYPERSVNWFTSELVTFTTTEGTETQAILYKPEDFNPAKKYPLLIHYYDKMSDELNRYRPPEGRGTGGDLDIAWFASHGYLVLLTDIIHCNMGKPGESIYKAVVGVAKHISKRPYVDKDHIGIQGHSFGGYETNYLVTHSNLFAAAASSAGVSDPISIYGSLWPDGSSVQEYFERRVYRITRPPWRASTIFTTNSPIFSVANVSTPVLIVHNKSDKNVPFEQGLEFFTALRRAGKQAWMLQYDYGNHGQSGETYKDYIIRTSQFFNHYLKGSPPPKWMVQGIQAVMKDIIHSPTVNKDVKSTEMSFKK